jgi:mRNA interferase HigB
MEIGLFLLSRMTMKKKHKTRLISKKKFATFLKTHPEHQATKNPFLLWHKTVIHATWTCFADVRETFGNASQVGKFVVFNLGGNKFRLVTEIRYNLKPRHLYLRHVLTHQEYDEEKWKE